MNIFDCLKQTLSAGRGRLATEINRFRNRTFLEGIMAGAVLIAAADGSISPQEKKKLYDYISVSEDLRCFSTAEIIEVFNSIADTFAPDAAIGKIEALKKVGRLRGKDNQARLLVRVAVLIAMSDGPLDAGEKRAVRELCAELRLSASDFDCDVPEQSGQRTEARAPDSFQPGLPKEKNMSVSLVKGGNVSLSKEAPGLESVTVGLGWDVRATDGAAFDLDASCFLLNAEGKVRSDADFIFYNNKASACGSVQHMGDNLTGAGDGDDEKVAVQLTAVPADVAKIAFAVTIHEAEQRKQNFGMVSNAFIRVVNAKDDKELARFDLSEDASTNTSLIFGELYRHNGEWKFRAVGQGYDGGLGALARGFGVNV